MPRWAAQSPVASMTKMELVFVWNPPASMKFVGTLKTRASFTLTSTLAIHREGFHPRRTRGKSADSALCVSCGLLIVTASGRTGGRFRAL